MSLPANSRWNEELLSERRDSVTTTERKRERRARGNTKLNKCLSLVAMVFLLILLLSFSIDSAYGEPAEETITKEYLIKKVQKISPPLSSLASAVQTLAAASNNQKFAIQMIKNLNGILVNLGPTMMIAGMALSIALAFLPKSDSPELAFMKEKFDLTINGIKRLERAMGDLETSNVLEHAKTAYGEYERTILDRYEDWQNAMNASSDSEAEKNASWTYFASQYEAHYKQAAMNLFKAMSNKFSNHLNRDLLQSARDKFKCNALNLQSLCAAVTDTILKGITVEGAYYGYQKRLSHAEREGEKWSAHLQELGDSCMGIINECRAKWKDYAQPLFSETFEKYKTADAKAITATLHKTLSAALPQRAWFAIAYPDSVGYKYHSIVTTTNDLFMEWHKNDKCVTVYSVDWEEINPSGNFSKQEQAIKDLQKRISNCDDPRLRDMKDSALRLTEDLVKAIEPEGHGIYVISAERPAYYEVTPGTFDSTRLWDNCENRKEKKSMQVFFFA